MSTDRIGKFFEMAEESPKRERAVSPLGKEAWLRAAADGISSLSMLSGEPESTSNSAAIWVGSSRAIVATR